MGILGTIIRGVVDEGADALKALKEVTLNPLCRFMDGESPLWTPKAKDDLEKLDQ